MEGTTEPGKSGKAANRSDHMANERTFLAWVRTAIGIMAFGFVVEKFTLFLKQLSHYFEKNALPAPVSPSPGYSSILGIALVAVGAVMGVLAFYRYKKVEAEISQDEYKPSIILDIMVTLIVVVIGVFLVFYMFYAVVK